jgi:hypothetical protein
MPDYETGLAKLRQLAEWAIAHSDSRTRNEASTRFYIIDALLKDVLQWSPAAITVERHYEGTYSDYELGLPSKEWVIEAKREGIYFDVPLNLKNETCAISELINSAEGIQEPIGQAMQYAQSRGIPVAGICNGHQLIIFLASRQDGIPPLTGRAVIFRSLQDMIERFRLLWDCLSAGANVSSQVARFVRAEMFPQPPQKLSQSIVNYPGYKNRNPIATELQILGGLFLEDLARHPEFEEDFLRSTYCSSGAISQYALVSKQLLRARYAAAFEKAGRVSASAARNKKGISPELRADVTTAALSKRPILLVGDVGVGKTMFIRHLLKVEASDDLKRAIVLYIDFGSKPALTDDLRPYVVAEISRQLLEDHNIDIYDRNFVRGVYHGDLRRFEESIWGELKDTDEPAFRTKEIEHLENLMNNQEEHLRACLVHAAKGEKRQVVVFFDNVDQRAAAFQEEVFLIAQAMAETWPLTAFVSIRPETFAQSRATGSLSAYQPRVFTIDPPRVDQVLAKRIEFGKRQLEETGRLPTFQDGLTVHLQTLGQYLDMLLNAFRERGDLVEFVDNMSGGNIRRALDFVASFIGSGHVDSKKILEIVEKQGYYILPLHEFLRAVAFGDAEHYDPSKSPLVNVFDTYAGEAREHFLLPLLVSYVERAGQLGGAEGYLSCEAVYNYAQGVGFHPLQIEAAIRRALDKGLLKTPVGLRDDGMIRLRVTTVGAYAIKRLPSMFAYVDAVVVDTPIMDVRTRSAVRECLTIEERLSRAHLFTEYLDASWASLTIEPQSWDWLEHSTHLRTQMDDIMHKIASRRGQGVRDLEDLLEKPDAS